MLKGWCQRESLSGVGFELFVKKECPYQQKKGFCLAPPSAFCKLSVTSQKL